MRAGCCSAVQQVGSKHVRVSFNTFRLPEGYNDDSLKKILMYIIAYIEAPTEQPLETQAIINTLQGISASLMRHAGHGRSSLTRKRAVMD